MTTRRVDVAEVHLWGRQLGAVAWDNATDLATFEYEPGFLGSGLEVAPFTMPLRAGTFNFPALSRDTYHGLPGLLADSLPDRFGYLLIDTWLARQGRGRSSFSPVEQLCYVGTRGMGALEYHPATRGSSRSTRVQVDELADLAAQILDSRSRLHLELGDDGLTELLRVGTSAGGARAKAVIAWNPETGEVRSGQAAVPHGFEHWLLKFDGVGSGNRGLTDPKGYGRIEYAYYLMATAAGIEMAPARLEVDHTGRAHFMTRRFDRTAPGDKLHMQSLSALRHFDFNQSGAYSYEDALSTTQGLRIPPSGVAQLYRRMVFNVVARNQDDHTKNIAYLMDDTGRWNLAPAFDVIWAYNPEGEWTNRHQMTINGKREGFTRDELAAVGRRFGVRNADGVIKEVVSVVGDWTTYATAAGVTPARRRHIGASHRLFT